MSRSRIGLLAALAVVAVLLFVGRLVSGLLVERAWYVALGAPAVWREQLLAQTALGLGGWLAGSLFAFANVWAVRATILSIAVPTRVSNLEIVQVVPNRRLLTLSLFASAAVGLVLCAPLPTWELLSSAWRGVRFVEYEGIWQHDLGFYVHWLPFEEAMYLWALIALTLVTAMVTFLYAVTRSLRLEDRRLVASTHARRHLSVLGALVLLLLAWSYRLDAYDLLRWGTGPDGLFTRVDHAYTLRADVALAVGALATALVVLRAGWVGHVRTAFYAVTSMLIAALVFHEGLPSVLARGEAFGPAIERDAPYRAMRATFSRRAWEVDGIRVRDDSAPLPVSGPIGERIGVWDDDVVMRAAGASARLVTPLTWRPGPTGPEGVIVEQSGESQSWTARVISGTRTTAEGGIAGDYVPLPGLLPGLAGREGDPDVPRAQPLIHPGAVGYRLIERSRIASALDRTGVRAVALDGAIMRLAHAWAERDGGLLGDDAAPAPAIVRHRDVRARVQRLVPGLALGSVVHPILTGDALVWALPLYGASDAYPLSVRLQAAGAPQRYLRFAGTALVDAATGSVRIVRAARPDPVAETWFALVPSLVVGREVLDASTVAQLPVPLDGSIGAARVFSRYGARAASARDRFLPDSALTVIPPPVLLDGPAIAWTLPVLERPLQLSGVILARGGAEAGTEWWPVRVPRPRWDSLRAELDLAIDSTLAALGSDSVTAPLFERGRVRVVLDSGRPVLVQPVFAPVPGERATRLAFVVVHDGGATAVGASTVGALARARGDERPAEPLPLEAPATRGEARRLFDAAREALRRGDFTRFGATLDSLGRVLERLPP